MGSLFVAVLVIIILVSLFYKSDDNYEKEEKEKEILARLEQRYRAALKAGNREQALKFGRDYYAYLRNSRTLSANDERAIASDLAQMRQGQ
jgi:predicted MPP superfamily phosphohydrolase